MRDETLYDQKFIKRLTQLRVEKGVSARDMSLSIGQNPGYINNIESGKALPSMANFFYICEYFNISPMYFFDFDATRKPEDTDELYNALGKLTDSQYRNILEIVYDLTYNK